MMTLVLSPEYHPINQVSLKRAVKLIVKGKVEVLKTYQEFGVVHALIGFFPSVVRLLAWVSKKKRGVRFSRENVYSRDKGRCQYCLTKLTRQEATYEHVVPKCKGGKTRWDNIVIACVTCNQKKGSRTSQEAGMKLVKKPCEPTALPETLRLFCKKEDTPETWIEYLHSVVYMTVELEQD